jgi:hypothetical protein
MSNLPLMRHLLEQHTDDAFLTSIIIAWCRIYSVRRTNPKAYRGGRIEN